jgi:hypothetical protein
MVYVLNISSILSAKISATEQSSICDDWRARYISYISNAAFKHEVTLESSFDVFEVLPLDVETAYHG